MLAKILAVEGVLVGIIIAAGQTLDGTAERIVLYAAAGAGLLWFWVHILRPLARIIRRVSEDLPDFMETTDRKLGLLTRRARENRSALIAVTRELDIEFRSIADPDGEDDDELDEPPARRRRSDK